MGEGNRRRKDRGSQQRVDGFSVTIGWADSATGEPEHEITLSGEEWDRLHMQCLQLTRRGAKVLGGLQVEHLDLDDLTPEKVDGAKLFFNTADLVKWCNQKGEEQ